MKHAAELLILSMIAIAFLQSGTDKLIDWKGNLSWLKPHFNHSALKNTVRLALAWITILELTSGILAVLGIGALYFYQLTTLAFFAANSAAITFLFLFLGQRLAKDYAGAQTIVIYFIPTVFLVFLLQF
jgi:hypothetical protein